MKKLCRGLLVGALVLFVAGASTGCGSRKISGGDMLELQFKIEASLQEIDKLKGEMESMNEEIKELKNELKKK